MDIVAGSGRGACMKMVPIKEDGRDWLHLVKFVDAIVICAGVGDAIEPT
jgi:hypothetical protein